MPKLHWRSANGCQRLRPRSLGPSECCVTDFWTTQVLCKLICSDSNRSSLLLVRLRPLRQFPQALQCGVINFERRGGNVFIEVRNTRGTRNRQNHRRTPQQPFKGQLRRRNLEL